MPNLEKEKLKFTLDPALIDMTRVYKTKAGKNLLEFECMVSPNEQYGQTHFITQRQTKTERDARTRLPILGNLGLAFPPKPSAPQTPAKRNGPQPGPDGSVDTSGVDSGDVPFSGAAE